MLQQSKYVLKDFESVENQIRLDLVNPTVPLMNVDKSLLAQDNKSEEHSSLLENSHVTELLISSEENNNHIQTREHCFTDFGEAMKFSKLHTPSNLKRIDQGWIVQLL